MSVDVVRDPYFEREFHPFIGVAQAMATLGNQTVSSETRQRIMARDGHQCRICSTSEAPFEIDHKVPVSRGGTHADSNLWLLCRQCNQFKGDYTVREFELSLCRLLKREIVLHDDDDEPCPA